jgi:hypothetical protein
MFLGLICSTHHFEAPKMEILKMTRTQFSYLMTLHGFAEVGHT